MATACRTPRSSSGAHAAFDATDSGRLRRFFDELPGPIDHLVIPGLDSRMPLEAACLAA
jgi:hypothetical protein